MRRHPGRLRTTAKRWEARPGTHASTSWDSGCGVQLASRAPDAVQRAKIATHVAPTRLTPRGPSLRRLGSRLSLRCAPQSTGMTPYFCWGREFVVARRRGCISSPSPVAPAVRRHRACCGTLRRQSPPSRRALPASYGTSDDTLSLHSALSTPLRCLDRRRPHLVRPLSAAEVTGLKRPSRITPECPLPQAGRRARAAQPRPQWSRTSG